MTNKLEGDNNTACYCIYAQNRHIRDESYLWCKLLERTCPAQYGNDCCDYEADGGE